MKKTIRTALMAVVLILTVLTGCAAPRPVSVTSTSGVSPAIVITYNPVFKGQTASGNLDLEVKLTIENRGYQAFNTSPALFSVVVDDYYYPASGSDLETAYLPDGGKMSGELKFQVPPAAATTRVGFQMAYSGADQPDIQWIKQTGPTGFAEDTPASSPKILISHYGNYMWIKDARSLYLMVNLTIENKGYESFNTSPKYFSLIIGNIFGKPGKNEPIQFDGEISDERDGAYTDLRTYDLQNGGKINGTLAFKVPSKIFASTESYQLSYAGVRKYNIEWTRQTQQPQ